MEARSEWRVNPEAARPLSSKFRGAAELSVDLNGFKTAALIAGATGFIRTTGLPHGCWCRRRRRGYLFILKTTALIAKAAVLIRSTSTGDRDHPSRRGCLYRRANWKMAATLIAVTACFSRTAVGARIELLGGNVNPWNGTRRITSALIANLSLTPIGSKDHGRN